MISLINKYIEKLHFKKIKRKVNNLDFTILSNTCIGGVIYHLLGLKFSSPMINLYISPEDFVKLLSDLDGYLAKDIIELKGEYKYPVGKLDDIIIHFKHYSSFNVAKEKWMERIERINKSNIIVMMSDRVTAITDTPYRCKDEVIANFDRLKYEKKIVFTSKKHINIKSSYFIKEFEADKVIGIITDYSTKLGKRNFMLSEFDLAKFINEGNYWTKMGR